MKFYRKDTFWAWAFVLVFITSSLVYGATGDMVLDSTTAANLRATTYGSDSSITDAELLGIDDGATTEVLVGGGAGSAAAWGTDIPTAVTIGSGYIYRVGGTDVADADVVDTLTITNLSQVQDVTVAAASLNAFDDGLTTQVIVGGGAGVVPVWGTDIPTAVTIGTGYIYRVGGTDIADADVVDTLTITNISQVGDISATASEINTPLDGALVTLTEFRELETIGATTISANQWTMFGGAAETLTSTELNYLDGVAGALYYAGGTDVPATDGGTGLSVYTQYALLYAPTTTTIAEITPAASSILVTSGANAPSLATDIPTAVTIGSAYIYRAGGTDVADADVADNISITNISQVADISATASEINTPLDGATVTLAEFQQLQTIGATTISANQWATLGGIAETLTAAELDILDGVTGVTAAELGYIGDVTSLIQAQIDLKAPLASPALTGTPAIAAATGTSLDLGGTTLFASRQITVDTGGVLDINLGAASGDDFTIDTTAFVVEGDTGYVGIGTAAPTADLEINGSLRATGFTQATSGSAAEVLYTGDVAFFLGMNRTGADAPRAAHLGGDGATGIRVDTGGNTGLGTLLPQSLLDVQGPVGTGATGAGILTLATKELTIVAADELGRINFNAPLESSGTDAILPGASIWAVAEAEFTAAVNSTSLIFATGASEAAAEAVRIDSAKNMRAVNSAITVGSGTGVTVNTIGHIATQTYKVTTTYDAYSKAATTDSVVIATLPAKMKIISVYADTTTPYTGGAVSAATLEMGITAEGAAEIIAAHDVLSGAVTSGLADADMGTSMTRAAAIQGGYLPSWTGTTAIYATIDTTTANTDALTAGSTTFYIVTEQF